MTWISLQLGKGCIIPYVHTHETHGFDENCSVGAENRVPLESENNTPWQRRLQNWEFSSSLP